MDYPAMIRRGYRCRRFEVRTRSEGSAGLASANLSAKLFRMMHSLTFSDRWHAFIDAYFHSIEFHPMSGEGLFFRRDADALMADFIRTQLDFAEARETILSDPQRFLAPEFAVDAGTGRRQA